MDISLHPQFAKNRLIYLTYASGTETANRTLLARAVFDGKEYEFPNQDISPNKSLPGMEDPKAVWTPSIAPSGLTAYNGKRFPQWQKNLFAGSLVEQTVRRIELDAHGKVVNQEQISIGARVRDVRQDPDDLLYILTDESDGRLMRLEPAQ
jgi:aldose sugar dehydrogenase